MGEPSMQDLYIILFVLFPFMIPFLILAFWNTRIVKKSRAQQEKIEELEKQVQVLESKLN